MGTGAQDLTSSGTVAAALTAAVPIALAGLGGLWSERAGVVNIGLEGQMVLGTWGAGFAGYQWGPWAGVAFGLLLGALGGLLHAVATVTFGVDHIVSGVAPLAEVPKSNGVDRLFKTIRPGNAAMLPPVTSRTTIFGTPAPVVTVKKSRLRSIPSRRQTTCQVPGYCDQFAAVRLAAYVSV